MTSPTDVPFEKVEGAPSFEWRINIVEMGNHKLRVHKDDQVIDIMR